MSTPGRLAKLTEGERRQLEAWLAEFHQSWDDKRLGAQVRKLPPPGSALRQAALTELVKIDLLRQWQKGHRAKLESYMKALPELGTAETVSPELIRAEMAARRTAGAAADPADFARRFPAQAAALGSGERAEAETLPPAQAGRPTWHAETGGAAGESPAAAGDLPGHFGRYRILRQLGKGGMGAVYLAHDTELDRKVALKVPTFAAGASPELLERFAREARAAATLSHPNLCPVYDVGEWQGTRYVTMAYVEGRPLSELTRGGKPLPQQPAAALVRKLALAMHEAHKHGVIHRDLKPSNVMVTKKEEPVIMDFGLARRAQEDARLTRSGAILGTPAYMSPEQVGGDAGAVGPATDVYSLGVILYELLTGQLPFRGPVTAVLARIMTEEPPPPRSLRADLDPALEAICQKAMAKQVPDRYGSMRDLAAALTAYLKGGGSVPRAARGKAEARPAAAPPTGDVPAADLLARLARRLDDDDEAAGGSRRPSRRGRGSRWPLAVGGLALLAAVAVIAYIAIALASKPQGPGGPPTVTVKTEVVVRLAMPKELADKSAVLFVLDGKEIAKEKLAGPVKLEPGKHVLRIRRADGREEVREIKVGPKDDGGTVPLLPPQDSAGTVVANGPTGKGGPVNPPAKDEAGKEEPVVPAGRPAFVLAKVDGPPLDEWLPLFNGKDLTGWGAYPEGTAGWDVQDGALVGSGPVSTLFSRRGWYRNFHVRIEALINDGGTSALGVRGKYGPGIPAGYRAYMNSTGGDYRSRTGALELDTGGSSRLLHRQEQSPVPPDTWFTFEVIATGNQLIVKVNGRETANYLDTNKTLSRGFFYLTHPDKATVIKVRRVEVKELPPPRPFVPPGPTPGWTQLFNGKDLTGWKGFPRETAGWEVKDGILVGSGPQGNLFSDRGDFKNFHLRVEARINHGGLSGLCCRGKYGPGDPAGYVAPINSTGNDSYRTGSLRLHTGGSVSGIERVTDTLVKPEVWFTLEVIARGTQLIVKVNGEETVNSIDQGNNFKAGNVVLERFDRAAVVLFRTIEVKELPP
jgi:predicted Ser/Thr protein kinase